MLVPLVLLGLTSAGTAVSAFQHDPSAAAAAIDNDAGHGHRSSLNFGEATPRKAEGSILNVKDDGVDSNLLSFNAATPSVRSSMAGQSLADSGLATAEAFVRSLHPLQEFRLQSYTQSAAGSVIHAHYVQVVAGRDVVDALININVDANTNTVLSYGDSAYAPKTAEACARVVTGSNAGSQFFFGASSKTVATHDECPISAKEVVDVHEAPIDPRIALANFIMRASPEAVSLYDSLDELVESMSVSHTLHADSTSGAQISIHGAPGAVAESGVPAKLSYVQRPDGKSLALTWSFEYESQENWYEAHVSAASEAQDVTTPLFVVDWVRDAPHGHQDKGKKEHEPSYSYRVFPWGVNDPSEGKRELLKNPAYRDSSPSGWHKVPQGAGRESGRKGQTANDPPSTRRDGPGWSSSLKDGAVFEDTRGNNVFAQDNPSGGTLFETNYRPHHDHGAFDYKLHWGPRKERPGHQVDPKSYINVSITELFYTCNEIHDLFHAYGFDEVSGNFQEHNFARGGLGGDAVVAMAQDGSGMNNANFATPPDGQRPRMRMYVWSGTPYTDGDLEAGIVIHEYMHGVSTRLTGGPANSGCLGFGEAGGMGEGYGDFAATMIRMQSAEVRDYSMGSWAAHRDGGIRKYPYSTNMTVNPSTYKTLDGPGYWGVHAIGEVYAEMMFEVAEALIAKHGWTKSLFPPAANETSALHDDFYLTHSETGRKYPKYGNAYALQLLVDSLKLQPCRPNFMNNRDAVIQADHIYTNGENECLIWKAFAKRGLGPDANVRGGTPWGGGIRSNDFSIPKKCVGKKFE